MCMFCDSGAKTTREHIFGSALNKAFPKQPDVMVLRSASAVAKAESGVSLGKKDIRKGGTKPLAQTSWSMCRDCNNELGKEMTRLTRKLAALFQARTNRIEKEYARLALRYFQRIALLIDLESSKLDTSKATESSDDQEAARHYPREEPFYSETDRMRFREGNMLPNIGVFLCRQKGAFGKGFKIVSVPSSGFLHQASKSQLLGRKFIFGIDNIYCLLASGDVQIRNPKLQRFDDPNREFRLNHQLVSSDEDVRLDLLNYTRFLDGSLGGERY